MFAYDSSCNFWRRWGRPQRPDARTDRQPMYAAAPTTTPTSAAPAPAAASTAAPDPYADVAFRAARESGLIIAARLTLPAAAARPMPAVVILHGSAGVDGRSIDHAQALQRAAIATLEVDLWSARWLRVGPPRHGHALKIGPMGPAAHGVTATTT